MYHIKVKWQISNNMQCIIIYWSTKNTNFTYPWMCNLRVQAHSWCSTVGSRYLIITLQVSETQFELQTWFTWNWFSRWRCWEVSLPSLDSNCLHISCNNPQELRSYIFSGHESFFFFPQEFPVLDWPWTLGACGCQPRPIHKRKIWTWLSLPQVLFWLLLVL